MKHLTLLFLIVITCACNSTVQEQNTALNQDLLEATDSLSQLMAKYHYNPGALSSGEYQKIQTEVQKLAGTAQTQEAFIDGFNALWSDGPFSHVRLARQERPAAEMAAFIDSLRVGDHSVALEWKDKTAILTVTTMTGVDTKERVFEAYSEIAQQEAEFLIIDLRNNTGGTFAGIPLVGHVLTDAVDVGMFVSRKWWSENAAAPSTENLEGLKPWQGWSIQSFWHDVQEQPLTRVKFHPMTPNFDGPVYVLTSRKTASAAEFAADAFAHGEQVTIIGETTAGEMLSQKMFDLPHGLQLSLPIAEYYSTRIGRIEGKGVEPDITIDQSEALGVAFALIEGTSLETALQEAQSRLKVMDKEPLGGEAIYLFGNMNNWGKKWDITPKFEYKGKGVYEAVAAFKKGSFEFKAAPMNWDFDYGAKSGQQPVKLGEQVSLIKKGGSDNLKIELTAASELLFSLDVSNKDNATLIVRKK